jgi:hypothetical protein
MLDRAGPLEGARALVEVAVDRNVHEVDASGSEPEDIVEQSR